MSTKKGQNRKTARRAYYPKRARTARRKSDKKVGLFSLIGVGLGAGMSAFSSNGASLNAEEWHANTALQVQNAGNGILAGVSGYDYDTKTWKASNLLDFWAPTIGFAIVDKIAGKMGMGKVKIYKNIHLAGQK